MWHVAAHEIGHAIYGLDAVKDAIRVSTKTLLEEPRAELTALHTMRLLLPAGLLTEVGACVHPNSRILMDLHVLEHIVRPNRGPFSSKSILIVGGL